MWGALSGERPGLCLQLLLVLASAVILGSGSHGARDHILHSQFRDFPFRRLLQLAGLRWRYSSRLHMRYGSHSLAVWSGCIDQAHRMQNTGSWPLLSESCDNTFMGNWSSGWDARSSNTMNRSSRISFISVEDTQSLHAAIFINLRWFNRSVWDGNYYVDKLMYRNFQRIYELGNKR
jgi:hypothetical protein